MKGRELGQSTVSFTKLRLSTLVAKHHAFGSRDRVRRRPSISSSLDLSRSHKDTGELPWPAGPLAERTSTVGERVRQLTVERPVTSGHCVQYIELSLLDKVAFTLPLRSHGPIT